MLQQFIGVILVFLQIGNKASYFAKPRKELFKVDHVSCGWLDKDDRIVSVH